MCTRQRETVEIFIIKWHALTALFLADAMDTSKHNFQFNNYFISL